MTNEQTPKDPLQQEAMFIDVSWNTKDERLDNAVDVLLPDIVKAAGTKRKDGKLGWRRHLRATLVIFVRAYQANPSTFIICSMNNNFGKDSYRHDYDLQNPERYNLKKIQATIRILDKLKYLKIHKGKRDFFDGKFEGRLSRIELNQMLHEFMDSHFLEEIEFEKTLINDGMVVGYQNEKGIKKIRYDYSDLSEPEHIKQSKVFLKAYNDLIAHTEVGLEQKVKEQIVNLNDKISFRTFTNDSYDFGGRFYGGWWTNCKRENRRYISINNQPTVECDYTANHLNFYCSLYGEQIPDQYKKDPYSINDNYPRSVIKLVINRLFNCDGRRGLVNHFNLIRRFPKGEKLENLELIKRHLSSAIEVNNVLDVIFTAYPILRQQTNKDQGLILQNWDSKIAGQVLKIMTDLDIPCLCIHDSFIVPIEFEEELREAMRKSYSFYPAVSLNVPEIKEKQSKLMINNKGIIEIEK